MSQIHPFDRPGVRAVISQRLKVSQQVLTNWKKRGVPVEFCNRICVATKGAVTRQELRPNDFWLIWPDLKAPKKAAQMDTAFKCAGFGCVKVNQCAHAHNDL